MEVDYEEFFALRLTKLRMNKNVSAHKMSVEIGQNKNYINQIENRKAFPGMETFFYICQYLDISPKEFFDVENENPDLLNELIAVLKTLDREALQSILDVAKKMAK